MIRHPIRMPAVLLMHVVILSACGGGGDEPAAPAQTTLTTAAPTSVAPSTAVAPSTVASTTTTAPGSVVAVTVRGGQVQGPSRQRVEHNQTVTIRVTSDVADEIHVHGYNRTAPVAAGGTGEVSFVANIPGVFEVEFERSGRLLFTLEVRS